MRILGVLFATFAVMSPLGAAPFPAVPPTLVAVKDVSATSTFADKRDAYAAWRALVYEVRGDDGGNDVLWSAWCEGKPDEGIGETVTIKFAQPTHLDSVRIAAGVWRTRKLHLANNQIRAIEVIVDGGAPRTLAPDGRKWLDVKVGAKVSTLALRIAAAKKGRMNDSCIAGIDLMRGGVKLVPVIGVDDVALGALPAALREINAAIGAPGRKGLEPLLAFPFTNNHVDGFFAGFDQKAVATSWAHVVAACKSYDARLKASEASGDAEYIDPKACPTTAPYDPDNGSTARTDARATVVIGFPAGREVMATWRLVWKGRWKLQAIDFES